MQRSDRDDGFGFSLSNGVYDSGVYVGAVKEKGPAANKLQPYDRILKVTLTGQLWPREPTYRVNKFELMVESACIDVKVK